MTAIKDLQNACDQVITMIDTLEGITNGFEKPDALVVVSVDVISRVCGDLVKSAQALQDGLGSKKTRKPRSDIGVTRKIEPKPNTGLKTAKGKKAKPDPAKVGKSSSETKTAEKAKTPIEAEPETTAAKGNGVDPEQVDLFS